jgi:hypothetical protein
VNRDDYISFYYSMYGHNPPPKLLEKYYPGTSSVEVDDSKQPCKMYLYEYCSPSEICPKSCSKNGGLST